MEEEIVALHSTIFRLLLNTTHKEYDVLFNFTFYYIQITTTPNARHKTAVLIFTFYYIQITTGSSQPHSYCTISISDLSFHYNYIIKMQHIKYLSKKMYKFQQLCILSNPHIFLLNKHRQIYHKKLSVLSSSIFPKNSLSSHL